MNKLTLYLGKSIIVAILLVLMLLVGLEFIFSLVNELRHVGTGDYNLNMAITFILFSLPSTIAQLFPMAALVGTLLGLSILASRSELIVMRASGWGMGDIIFAVMKLAVVLIFFAWILGEWVAPTTDRFAHHQKALSLSEGKALRTAHGTWMKDGDNFVHIQSIDAKGHLEGITRYEFDNSQVLKKSSFAQYGDYEQNKWVLHQINETIFEKDKISNNHVNKEHWVSHIDPNILNIVGVKNLDELSLVGLWQTIRYRKGNELDARPYQLAFWQKCLRPLATCVMMFLAIPFIFGPLRSATMGFRMLIGVFVGFAFFTIHELFGPLTLVYQMPPILGACLPTLLFFAIGMGLLKKTAV